MNEKKSTNHSRNYNSEAHGAIGETEGKREYSPSVWKRGELIDGKRQEERFVVLMARMDDTDDVIKICVCARKKMSEAIRENSQFKISQE